MLTINYFILCPLRDSKSVCRGGAYSVFGGNWIFIRPNCHFISCALFPLSPSFVIFVFLPCPIYMLIFFQKLLITKLNLITLGNCVVFRVDALWMLAPTSVVFKPILIFVAHWSFQIMLGSCNSWFYTPSLPFFLKSFFTPSDHRKHGGWPKW